MEDSIHTLWNNLYGTGHKRTFDRLISFLKEEREKYNHHDDSNHLWYKEAVIFSLYVDSFAGSFSRLEKKLPYMEELGVNTLWLLPILDSPMNDQGFDIRDFYKVRDDLGTTEDFFSFIRKAHERGIRILFDVAVNHTSDQHHWFKEAASGRDSKYRNYYHWSNDSKQFSRARLLFKGMVPSNWQYNEQTRDYYFHRFYTFQPDLNYGNPEVFLEMVKMLAFWKSKGVDGLRMDACPFIWKEEGTTCEDLPKTHSVLKLFRASLDFIKKGTMLIAEANMRPKDVAKYFGSGDECQTAYHFQLMAKLYLAIADSDYKHIEYALLPEVTPEKPANCQWISFLRCHDELTLEFVSAEDRKKMNEYYLKDKRYTFREGEGISGRLYNLLDKNAGKVICMFSMLFSTLGSPVIYYGDEVAMENDEAFFKHMARKTGFKDSRFFNRGDMNWKKAGKAREDSSSDEAAIFKGLKKIIKIRKQCRIFFDKQGIIIKNSDRALYQIERISGDKKLVIIHNLSDIEKVLENDISGTDLILDRKIAGKIAVKPFQALWIVSDTVSGHE